MTQVEFHFDVMCPWAYQTSKWIREAREVRDITVEWRFFSLEEVNRGDGKHPWQRRWSYGWSMLRVAEWLRRHDRGNERVDAFYRFAGAALHEEGRKVHTPEGVKEVLAALGEDPAIVDAAIDDPSTNDAVRADHERVLDLGGFGVPTLVLDGTTPLFGPVITPAPTGEAAGRLWDCVAAWAEFPHLYELRRPKTAADWDHIGSNFAPYLDARDWKTVQNPVA